MTDKTDALVAHDPSKPNAEQGLYRKFDVRRTDGSDAPGGKHDGCEYFVLDLTHDAHAPAALTAYAAAAERTHPMLARDLRERYALAAPAEGGQRYSDDRLSLAQEIRDALKVRGHWTPDNWAGPDLITAVAKAIEKTAEGAQGEAAALREFYNASKQDNATGESQRRLEAAIDAVRLIDSAGGAKGEEWEPTWTSDAYTIDHCNKDDTPQPAEGDGAVDELLIEELRKVAIRDSTTIKTGQVIGRAIAALQARPAATAVVPDGFKVRPFAERGKDEITILCPSGNAVTVENNGRLEARVLYELGCAILAAAPAAPKGGVVVSIEAAEAMGATGAPASESERQAFEAWMRGHCWSLCATWNGTEYRSDAEQGGRYCPQAASTRQLWAAWRDRAALATGEQS